MRLVTYPQQRYDDDTTDYGEVDLDAFLAAPPELADGWETPTTLLEMRRAPPASAEEEEAEEDAHGDDGRREDHVQEGVATTEDDEDGDQQEEEEDLTPRRLVTSKQQVAHEWEVAHDASLADTLWRRMRKARKLKHAPDRRAKDQDPTYRVRKILRLAAPNQNQSQNQNQNQNQNQIQNQNQGETLDATTGVMWSSSGKKSKKVKLPSLVERLRNKTAAAR